MAYTKSTNFAIKDSLLSGNPQKVVKGTEIDAEFAAVAVADAKNIKREPSGPVATTTIGAGGGGSTVEDVFIHGSTANGYGGRLIFKDSNEYIGIIGGSDLLVGDTTKNFAISTDGMPGKSLILATGSTERMRLDNNGHIGVNTDAPNVSNIYSADSRVVGIAGSGNSINTSFGAVALQNNRPTSTVGDILGAVTFSSKNATGSGTTPSYKAFIAAYNEGSGGASGGFGSHIRFATRGDNSTSIPQERMRIDSAGNVGVGVTPSSRANWKGFEWVSGELTWTGNTQVALDQNAYMNASDQPVYKQTFAASRYMQANGGHTWFSAPSGTAGNTITFTQVLAVEQGKSLALQGATSQTGAGISFPVAQVASADANTLDDYEEGTFTPTIVGTTTAGAGTYSVQIGRYTKIGRIVHYQINLVWSAHTGTGNMNITGLPFTTVNVANAFSVASVYDAGITMTAGNIMQAYTNANGTTVVLEQLPTGGGSSIAIPIDTAGQVIVSGSYEAA